jgi:DNA-binding PadR family transcriptional regulator
MTKKADAATDQKITISSKPPSEKRAEEQAKEKADEPVGERDEGAQAASDRTDRALAPVAQAAAAAVEAATAAASSADNEPESPGKPGRGRKRGAGDPLVGEARRELLPLLVLHYTAAGPSYGNQLIDRVSELTAGTLTVNPNTMYPLLRDLEARGLIEGQWEHPERRTRRFYTATAAGRAELAALRERVDASLAELESSVGRIRSELAGN